MADVWIPYDDILRLKLLFSLSFLLIKSPYSKKYSIYNDVKQKSSKSSYRHAGTRDRLVLLLEKSQLLVMADHPFSVAFSSVYLFYTSWDH